LLLVAASECRATQISFPVSLDPTVPNAWLVATYLHFCGGCIPDESDESTSLTGGSTLSQSGVLNLANLADGPGGGAFADLTHGALGVDSVGFPDGSGEGVHSYLIVNVPITGAGTNTVHFNVSGSSAVAGCVNIDCENTFGSYLSVYSVGGVQASTSQGGCEGIAGCTGIPFPENLSITFNSTAGTHIYQFQFDLFGGSNGTAGIFATNTGLASINLAPGVTMDTSSGFLTQAGDPNLGGTPAGPTPVPEPTTLALVGAGLIAARARRSRR
jgi:hypothetical protein